MKSITSNNINHLCLLVFLFISLINTHDHQVLGAEEPNIVRDIDGDMLRVGTDYYILSYLNVRGGVELASRGDKPCPLYVSLAKWWTDNGLPTKFFPVFSFDIFVRVSTELNIKFSEVITICNQTTMWKLDDISSSGQYFITTEGNPGPEIDIRTRFKIEEHPTSNLFYKFVYCPMEHICKDVGLYSEDGKLFLVLSDEPYYFVFKKVASPLAMI